MKTLRRLSTLFILLLLVVSVYADGIGSAKELLAFASAVNRGADLSEWQDEKGVVYLECDIDMKKAKKLPVITAFNGIFDGKGYALKNWKAKDALIHELKAGGIVRNLRIDSSCSMKAVSGSEEFVRGFIVNINSGTLRNCENYGSIDHRADLTEQSIFIGGLCGINRYILIDCKNGGNIKSETLVATASKKAQLHIGGLAGSSRKNSKCASYIRCENSGNITVTSDMPKANFVYISVPDGYKVPFRNSIPQIFRRIYRHSKGAIANFALEKRDTPMDNYIVAMVGDPQMRGFNHDTSSEKFRDVIIPDIVELAKREGKELFTINLGDLCHNWMPAYDDYLDIVTGSGLDMFHVIGNHDFDQATILETKLGTIFFEEYISPINYSFNIGKIHYVVVNNINYARANAKKHYSYGLGDEDVEWLEQDLSFVPKDHSIVICAHAQLHRHIKKAKNYKRYSAALAQFKKVYSWSGHYHNNFGADFEGKTEDNLGNVIAVAVARCSGNLRANRDLHIDGTPNGYMTVEVNGDNVEWYYKSVGHDRDYQIRAYTPIRTGDGYVKACIWNYTKGFWSEPEWWENGVKVGTLEQHKEEDLDCIEIHKAAAPLVAKADPSVTWTSSKGKVHDYTKPAKSNHMFRIKPSEGVRSGEIRITDNFGKTYSCKIEW